MDSFKKSIENAQTNFGKLSKKTLSQAAEYPGSDARHIFFSVYTFSNLWLLIQLEKFFHMFDDYDLGISQYISLEPKAREVFLEQYDNINRTAYLTKTMFQVEYFLKEILISLGENLNGEKYSKLAEQLLNSIDMNDGQKLNVLNTPAKIRNSLHNNGYSNYDFKATIRGQSFKFVKGARVDCTGWDNLYIIFDELVGLLIEIIKSAKVQKINHIPPTTYVQQ